MAEHDAGDLRGQVVRGVASSEETIGDLRGIIVRSVVLAVHDDGEVQTIDVQTHDGVIRTGIEVQQFFGHGSNPPPAGATALLMAVGGDPGHFVALPIGSPRRFGGQRPGDSTLYASDGSRVAVHNDGTIEVLAGTKVIIRAPEIEIDAPGGLLTITANTVMAGGLTVSGTLAVAGVLRLNGVVMVAP